MLSKLLPNNEHAVERVARTVIGAGVLSLVFIGPQSMWGLIGLIPLMTGLIGSCPIYTIAGISTCRMKTPAATKS